MRYRTPVQSKRIATVRRARFADIYVHLLNLLLDRLAGGTPDKRKPDLVSGAATA